MIRYIEQHKHRFGGEAICRVLRPAVSGFITRRGRSSRSSSRPSSGSGGGRTSGCAPSSTTAPRSTSSRPSRLPWKHPCQQPLDRETERNGTQAESESIVGLYKTECTKVDKPLKTVDELKLATLAGATGSTPRLHSALNDITPVRVRAGVLPSERPPRADARGTTDPLRNSGRFRVLAHCGEEPLREAVLLISNRDASGITFN
jgi:hypothetical protein